MSGLRLSAVALVAGLVLALAACTPSEVERSSHAGDLGGDGLTLAGASSASHPDFGQIVPVCGLTGAQLGRKVETLPARGRPVWTLYDTAPGTSAPRAFHITGFRDGCPRRVTAALAMFGSVELYEMVRMTGLTEEAAAETDRAYAEIRRGPCGAARRPCTGTGIRSLSRSTAFLTAFPQKASGSYMEVLLHNGSLAATAQR